MISSSLLAFVGTVLSTLDGPAIISNNVVPRAPTKDDPAIRVWINHDGEFQPGDDARIEVETNYDGYLIVLNYTTDGRVRVLFPVDPEDDQFVHGGRRYEIEGRGDRESFDVGGSGDGMIYAAISPDPFRFDDVEDRGNWDYHRISIDDDSDDPEADLTDLVEKLSTDHGFDYDIADYWVGGGGGGNVSYIYNWRSGYPGYWDRYCDPWDWPNSWCRYHPGGWYFSFSYYSYHPHYYSYYSYRPYYYSYPRHWSGWNRNRYYRYPKDRNYRVVGRPRSYTVIRRSSTGWVRTRERVAEPRQVDRKSAKPDRPARPRSTRARRVTYDDHQQPSRTESRTLLGGGRRDRSGSDDVSNPSRPRGSTGRRSDGSTSGSVGQDRDTKSIGRRSGDIKSETGTIRRRNGDDSDSRTGSIGRRSGRSGGIGRRSDDDESGSVGRRSGETRSGSIGRRSGDDTRPGSVRRRSGESGSVGRRSGGEPESGSAGRRSGGRESGSVERRSGGESGSGSAGRRSEGSGGSGKARGSSSGGSSKGGGSAKGGGGSGGGKSGGSSGGKGGRPRSKS